MRGLKLLRHTCTRHLQTTHSICRCGGWNQSDGWKKRKIKTHSICGCGGWNNRMLGDLPKVSRRIPYANARVETLPRPIHDHLLADAFHMWMRGLKQAAFNGYWNVWRRIPYADAGIEIESARSCPPERGRIPCADAGVETSEGEKGAGNKGRILYADARVETGMTIHPNLNLNGRISYVDMGVGIQKSTGCICFRSPHSICGCEG